MEIKRDGFLKEVRVEGGFGGWRKGSWTDVEESCLGKPQEKKQSQGWKGRKGHRQQINGTNEKKSGLFLDAEVKERKRKLQHGKTMNPHKKNTTVDS